jgi:hypothetical protein
MSDAPDELPREAAGGLMVYRRFYRAARKGDRDTILRLIADHPDLHAFQGDAGTWVEILYQSAPGLLEAAFQAGLSPDALSDPTCQTLLQHAAAQGDLDRMRLLLAYGADPEKCNDWGEVAIGYACSWGQLEAVKLLVEAGADVNAVEVHREKRRRNTPLDCTDHYPEIADYLRSKGRQALRGVGLTPPLRHHPV